MELLATYIESIVPKVPQVKQKPEEWYDATFYNYHASVTAYVDPVSVTVCSDHEPIYEFGSPMPRMHTRRNRRIEQNLKVIFKTQKEFDDFFIHINQSEFQMKIESIVYGYCRILALGPLIDDYLCMTIQATNS